MNKTRVQVEAEIEANKQALVQLGAELETAFRQEAEFAIGNVLYRHTSGDSSHDGLPRTTIVVISRIGYYPKFGGKLLYYGQTVNADGTLGNQRLILHPENYDARIADAHTPGEKYAERR